MRSPGAVASQAVAAVMPDGLPVRLQPVRPEDAGKVQSFVRALSPQSRYSRFLGALSELLPHMLRRLTQPVLPHEFGLLALAGGPGARSVVGMGHCVLEEGSNAELAVVVADAWQRRGIGTRLVQALAHRASGVEALRGIVLAENRAMLALARRLGFRVLGNPEPGLVQIEKLVTPADGGTGRVRATRYTWSE